MASNASTYPATRAVRFAPDFALHIPDYENAIRRHKVARWARQRGLEDDLVQLALIDLARVDSKFDSARASSPHHFRMAVLGSRVMDCYASLKRMHDVVIEFNDDREDASDQDGYDAFDDGEPRTGTSFDDFTQADAIREEMIRALTVEVAALPAGQRRILELALLEYSDREIAEHFGISIQAANTTRRKGLAKIQARMREGHLN